MKQTVALVVLASISIAFAKTGCAKSTFGVLNTASHATVHGGGSRSSEALMNELLSTYVYEYPERQTKYTGTSSHSGICRVLKYADECDTAGDKTEPLHLDFALSEVNVSGSQASTYGDVEITPFVATAIVPVYNLPGLEALGKTLILSPNVLARILRRCNESDAGCQTNSIRYWNHEDILALNPGMNATFEAAGEIKPVVISGDSGVTLIMKSSLALHDSPAFANQVPIDDSDNWGPSSLALKRVRDEVLSYIMTTPSSIGYVELPRARLTKARFAELKLPQSDLESVIPNVYTIDATVTEMGSIPLIRAHHEDTSHDAVEMSVGLWGSVGQSSWPFVGYTYLIYRAQTLRDGATCATRVRFYEFLKWFYLENESAKIAHELGYSTLTQPMAIAAFNDIESHLKCGTESIHVSEVRLDQQNHERTLDAHVFVSSSHALDVIFLAATRTYNRDRVQGDRIDVFVSETPIYDAFLNPENTYVAGAIAVIPSVHIEDPENYRPMSPSDFVSLPFAAIGVGALYNLCDPHSPDSCPSAGVDLRLTPEVIVSIVNGEITKWDDARIAKHNPGAPLPVNKTILVLPVVPTWTANVASALSNIVGKDVTYSAVTDQYKVHTEDESSVLVNGLAYSFYVGPAVDPSLRYAKVARRDDADFVAPTVESIEMCAHDSFDLENARFDFRNSAVQGCYPIVVPIYVVIKQKFTENECDILAGAAAISFVQRFFGLSDSEFYIGAEEYDQDGINLFYSDRMMHNQSYSSDEGHLVNSEIVQLRNGRIGIDLLTHKWDLGSLIAPPYVNGTGLLRHRYMVELEKIMCGNVSFATRHQDLNEITAALHTTAFVLCSLAWFAIFMVAAWIFRHWKARIVRNNSPIFLLMILAGAAIGIIAVPLFAIDDGPYFDHHMKHGIDEATQAHLDLICNIPLWVIGIGYSVMISSLYVKMWRIVRIFINPKLRKVMVTDIQLMKYQVMIVMLFVLELVLSQVFGPHRYVRTPITVNHEDGSIEASAGACVSENPWVAYIPLMLTVVGTLVYGNYISFKSRKIPSSFSEGTWIAVSLGIMFQAYVFGIPVIVLASDNPTVAYFSKAVLTVVTFAVAPLFLFVPKFLIAYGWISSEFDALKISQSSSQDSLKKTGGRTGNAENNNSKVANATNNNNSKGEQNGGRRTNPSLTDVGGPSSSVVFVKRPGQNTTGVDSAADLSRADLSATGPVSLDGGVGGAKSKTAPGSSFLQSLSGGSSRSNGGGGGESAAVAKNNSFSFGGGMKKTPSANSLVVSMQGDGQGIRPKSVSVSSNVSNDDKLEDGSNLGSSALRVLLENPRNRSVFEKHLESEFAAEVLTMYMDCETFKKSFYDVNESTRRTRAKRIVFNHVDDNAHMQVNLPETLRVQLKTAVNDPTSVIVQDFFKPAQRELFNMLLGSYQRFTKSPLFKEVKN